MASLAPPPEFSPPRPCTPTTAAVHTQIISRKPPPGHRHDLAGLLHGCAHPGTRRDAQRLLESPLQYCHGPNRAGQFRAASTIKCVASGLLRFRTRVSPFRTRGRNGPQRGWVATRAPELGSELAARAFSPGPPAPGKSSLWTLYTFGHIDGDCRVMSAWNWKYRAVQTRRRLGFEMPTPIKWPTLNLWLEWKEVHEEWKEAQDSVDEPGKRCACLETELEAMLMSRLSRPRH